MCDFVISLFHTFQSLLRIEWDTWVSCGRDSARMGMRLPVCDGLRWKRTRTASLCLGSIIAATKEGSWQQLLPFWQVTSDVLFCQ